MKKTTILIGILLIFGMITPAFADASYVDGILSRQKVTLNGDPVEIGAYNLLDENYFKLRDLAAVMKDTKAKFNVEFDEDANAINLTPGETYTLIEGDLKPLDTGEVSGVPSPQKVLLNGEEVAITAYNINDNNYYRLRDLGELFRFGVDYDEESDTVLITSPVDETKEPAKVDGEREKFEKFELDPKYLENRAYTLTMGNSVRLPFQKIRAYSFDKEAAPSELSLTEADEEKIILILAELRTLQPAGKDKALESAPDEDSLMLEFNDYNKLYMYSKKPQQDGLYYYTFNSPNSDVDNVYTSEKDLITSILNIIR